MQNHKNQGFRAAFRNAFLGFHYALSTEKNLKRHFAAGILAVAAGLILQISLIEWCIILLTINTVIVAELLNTALEYTVDIASPEKREMARRAKDVSAAAVLVTASCSVIVGLLIYLPKILPLVDF